AAAHSTVASRKSDGRAPLWGDADDARALPLGTAPLGEHGHLIASAAVVLDDRELLALARDGGEEVLWLFGSVPQAPPVQSPPGPGCAAFERGGAYVLRAG